MTYNVFGGTLSLTQSIITQQCMSKKVRFSYLLQQNDLFAVVCLWLKGSIVFV